MKRMDPPARSLRRRNLTREELDLWRQVTQTVAPFTEKKIPIFSTEEMKPEPVEPDQKPAPLPKPRRYEVPGYTPTPQRPASALTPLSPLERRLKQRLSRGRADVDAVMDLHGLRQSQAHSVLRGFRHKAQAGGAKVVLVITGKGRNPGSDETEGGVLRRSVPQWLRAPELRAVVVGFEEAGHSHGGAGALYIRIRRPARPSGGWDE